MPIDYDIDDGVIVVRLHGRVTGQEFSDYLAKTEKDPRYSRDFPRLAIISTDATFPPSPEIIQQAAKTPQRQIPAHVRFGVVAITPLTMGIASMFMGNAGLGSNFQLFDDEAKAKAWVKGTA